MELSREKVKKIKAICFDRDGVVVKKGTWWTDGKLETYHVSQKLKVKIQKLAENFKICITSGRSLEFLEGEWSDIDVSLHAEIGNFVKEKNKVFEEEWTQEETEKIKEIKLKLIEIYRNYGEIKDFEPKRKIITLHCWQKVAEVEKIAADSLVYCWWNGEAYDIGPKRIDKLTGIKKWIGILGVDLSEVMMVGHGVNDQGAMGGVGLTVNVGKEEEVGGERVIDKFLGLV